MAIMLAKTYAAFKAAGAPEEDAVAAAEELADYENRLTSIDNRLSIIEARVTNLENALTQFRADVQRSLHDVDLGGRHQRGGDDRDPGDLVAGARAIGVKQRRKT